MDAYVLLQTEPGLASTVMNALVESDIVDRALCITGTADVFARINDVDWAELKDRLLNRLQRVPGVVRSSTHIAVSASAVARGLVIPHHVIFFPIADDTISALVFVQIAPGSAREVVRAVRDLKGVLAMALVTGEHDLIVQVRGTSIDRLASAVLQQIQTIPGVTATSTSLVLAATPLRKTKPRRRKSVRRRRKR